MKIIPSSIVFRINAETDIVTEFNNAFSRLNEKQERNVFTPQFIQDLKTAFVEGVTNTIRHAQELKLRGEIACRFSLKQKYIVLFIEDYGPGFCLEKVPLPRFRSFMETGRGVFMMRQLMDTVTYQRGKRKNVLILKRALVGVDPKARDLEILHEISSALLLNTKPESVLQLILDRAADIFNAQRASILALDKKWGHLKVVASRGLAAKIGRETRIQPGEGISGFVFQHLKPCLVTDIEKNTAGWKRKKRYKSCSFISAPLVVSSADGTPQAIGVINITDRKGGRQFTKKDLRLLTTLANQAAASAQIFKLVGEARDSQSLKRELEIARDIQTSYLPRKAPKIDGLEMAGWIAMAQSIGGDYYDFLRPDDDNLYIVIADVSGHNIAAAMTMVNFRSRLKGLLLEERDPGILLTRLNQSLYDDLDKNDQFISVLLVRYALKTGQFEIANAGHRMPYLLKKSGASPFQTAGTGAVFGALDDENYASFPLHLEPGEGMLLYTDGITEAADKNGLRFGMKRLEKLLQENRQGSADDIIKHVREALDVFQKGTAESDDATAVAIRLHTP